VAYARSIQALPQDLLRVRPTVLAAVPRVFQKFHDRVRETLRAAPWWRRLIFRFARRVGRAWSRRMETRGRAPGWLRLAQWVADRLVWRKLRARLGGRLRFAFVGGAPLGESLGRFFHAAGVPLYEGYGLTETSPVIAVNTPAAWRLGTVGRPLPNVSVRLDPEGEICVRGPTTTRGYHAQPAATAALFDADGWLRTGDLGRIDADGFLAITGRKKELIVTAGGKKVAPGPLEDALRAEPWVAEAVCCGEGRPFLTALIVPDYEAVRRAMPDGPNEDNGSLCRRPAVRARFAAALARAQQDRPHWARVRRFWLLPEPFTEAGGDLTPTQKVRRAVVAKKHAGVIAALYEGAGTEVSGEERSAADGQGEQGGRD
jgi:long-chain acyl-CoA synthetase